jgi:hypothetical protein
MSQKASAVTRAQQSEVQPHQPGQEVFKTILSEDVDWKLETGVVSMLDKFPCICYNRLWTYCLLGGSRHGKDGD